MPFGLRGVDVMDLSFWDYFFALVAALLTWHQFFPFDR
jgi:hypothetical protein